RPDEAGRHAQAPEFRGAECFNHSRTRTCRAAAIEQASRTPPARNVVVPRPPQNWFAARLVERRGAAWRREAEIHRRLPGGNKWKDAVPDDPPFEILVESEMNKCLEEVACLRSTSGDAVDNQPGDGIRCSEGIRFR